MFRKRNHLRTWITLLLTAAIMAAALSGCGPAAGAGSTADSDPAADTGSETGTDTAESSAASDGSGSETAELKPFALGTLATTGHILAFVAKEEGFFAEEGLDVEVNRFSSAAEMAAALEGAKLDAAFFGSVPAITFQSQGRDLTIFGGAMSNGHGYVIKQEAMEAGKEGVELLVDKHVAVAKYSVMDAELKMLLKNAGIGYGDEEGQVHIEYFDTPGECYAALSNQEIDASCVFPPYISRSEQEGYQKVYMCVEEEACKNQPCCRAIAETTNFKENPEMFVSFEKALIRAYKFYQENHEGSIADAGNYIDLDASILEKELYDGYVRSYPDPDKQATVAFKDVLLDLGIIEDYDIEPYFNLDIYRKALDSILAEYPGDEIYKELDQHFKEFD